MREIKATQDKSFIVDDEDYEKVMRHHWSYTENQRGIPYFRTRIGRTSITVHRFIMGLKTGDPLVVDHINGDTFDNRKCNLRVCTAKENSRNRKPLSKTGYKGVRLTHRKYRENMWMAYIELDGKSKYLGIYTNPQEAALSYNEAAIKYFGEYARLNTL